MPVVFHDPAAPVKVMTPASSISEGLRSHGHSSKCGAHGGMLSCSVHISWKPGRGRLFSLKVYLSLSGITSLFC